MGIGGIGAARLKHHADGRQLNLRLLATTVILLVLFLVRSDLVPSIAIELDGVVDFIASAKACVIFWTVHCR